MAERKKIEIIKKRHKFSALDRDFSLTQLKEENEKIYWVEIYKRQQAEMAMREVDDETFKLFLEFHYQFL